MPQLSVSRRATIPAAAAVVYDLLADYRGGHQRILSADYFGPLEVLAGGRGEGTRLRLELRAFGRVTSHAAEITEPVPGRELRESLDSGLVTTFVVEPTSDTECRVTMTSHYRNAGLRNWVERSLSKAHLGLLLSSRLALLAQVVGATAR